MNLARHTEELTELRTTAAVKRELWRFIGSLPDPALTFVNGYPPHNFLHFFFPYLISSRAFSS